MKKNHTIIMYLLLVVTLILSSCSTAKKEFSSTLPIKDSNNKTDKNALYVVKIEPTDGKHISISKTDSIIMNPKVTNIQSQQFASIDKTSSITVFQKYTMIAKSIKADNQIIVLSNNSKSDNFPTPTPQNSSSGSIDGYALWGFILSLVAIFGLFFPLLSLISGILGLIFSIMGYNRTRGGGRGHVLAIAGIIISGIFLLVGIGFLARG
jgi:Na+-transporting NADH:ubiquinone oxidoreductase subunit NqrC